MVEAATVVAPSAVVAPAAPAPLVAPGSVVAPAPFSRVRERQVSTPYRTRYQYNVDYPGGPDYRYRYRQNGGRVRFSERWDD